MAFVRRYLADQNWSLTEAARKGLPRSSFLAWSKLKHRITQARASTILAQLGTTWHAFKKSGTPVTSTAVPAQLIQAWRLAGLWQAISTDPLEVGIKPGPEEPAWILAPTHTIMLQPDGWVILCKGSDRVLEGRISQAMEREILRALTVKSTGKKVRRSVCVSRLQRRLAAVHVRA